MAARRKLIVVSNRGPVSFARDDDGNRVARRGGGGLVTALRSLVAHHDVTWIASAMTDEDRAVADEAGGEAIEEVARDGSSVPAAARRARPAGLRLVLQRRREPDALVPPALPVGARVRAGHRPRAPPRLGRGLRRRSTGRSPTPSLAELDARARRGRLLPRLPPLPRAAVRPRRAARTRRSATSSTSRGRSRTYWRVLPERDPARDPRRAARERRRRLPRASLAPELPALEPRPARAPSATSSASVCSYRRRTDVRRRAADLGRPVRVRGARRERAGACGWRTELESRRPEFLILRVDRTDPSKNVVRGFRAFEFYLDAHPEMHGRVGMLALLDPSRQDIPEYAEYLGAIQRAARDGQRPLPARRLDAGRPADRGQLPALGRRVQAVRRAARERDLRRAEPRREGGAARQRARRRADPLRERRRARGARRRGRCR